MSATATGARTLEEELEAQLNGANADEVEDAATFLVERGRYEAYLESSERVEANNGNNGTELTFVLLGGKKPGKKVEHTLYATGKDSSATQKMLQQYNLFRLRLGLAVRDGEGKIANAPGKRTFADVRGARCLLDIVIEKGTNEKTGREWEKNAVKFCGIHAVDDEKAKGGAFLAGAATVAKAAEAVKKDDLSDVDV